MEANAFGIHPHPPFPLSIFDLNWQLEVCYDGLSLCVLMSLSIRLMSSRLLSHMHWWWSWRPGGPCACLLLQHTTTTFDNNIQQQHTRTDVEQLPSSARHGNGGASASWSPRSQLLPASACHARSWGPPRALAIGLVLRVLTCLSSPCLWAQKL